MNRLKLLVPFTLVTALLATLLQAQPGTPHLLNPYGLSEDLIDGLQLRDFHHRIFADFFSALLLNDKVNRETAFNIYEPIRELTIQQNNVYRNRSVFPTEDVRVKISTALWKLSSPELLKIDISSQIVTTQLPSLQFTRGVENRVLILLRNRSKMDKEIRVEIEEGPLHFRPLMIILAPGEVHANVMRVWGLRGKTLNVRVNENNLVKKIVVPLKWCNSSRLLIRVLNEHGSMVPARVEVTGSDGLGRAPSGTFLRYTPIKARPYFHTRGASTLVLPTGKTHLRVVRGFEYLSQDRVVDLNLEGPHSLDFRLERFVDAAAHGWYSGDIHIHPNLVHKNMDQLINPEDIRLQVEAEDLNVANLLVCNSQGSVLYDRAHFTGTSHSLSSARHILYWSQEIRPVFYGHIGVLNLKRFLEPPYNGFPTSFYPFDYPSNTTIVRNVRREGAAVFYVHPSLKRKRWMPVDVSLGTADGMEILGYADTKSSNDLYQLLLDCGWRLSAVAGTDTFNNIRRHKILGGDRVYAYTGDTLAYEPWVRALQQGRTFVTNGPLLFFKVQGRLPGSEIQLSTSGPVELDLEIHSQVPMEEVEILFNSQVVRSISLQDPHHLLHREMIWIPSSGWLAARVNGGTHPLVVNNPTLFAHTSPIYITVAGRPHGNPKTIYFFLEHLEKLRQACLNGVLFESLHQQRQVLLQIAESEKKYRELLEVLHRSNSRHKR